VSAELIAAKWGITREEMDAYSAQSHQRAAACAADGRFAREIIPVEWDGQCVSRDETIRPGTSVAALAELKPSFPTPELSERFPELRWGITAGNSSQLGDGASAMLLASERMAARLGLRPRARFAGFDVVGDDLLLMLTAPIPATRRVLRKAGLRLQDIDQFEVNEAFASVPVSWLKDTGADPDRLNVHGGAIALGHPLGATGAIRAATVVHALQRRQLKYGMVTMCVGMGQGAAGIIERV
jgi:acetyl-CoA acetyltransferase family protein